MNKILILIIGITIPFNIFCQTTNNDGIGIGTTNVSQDAILEIESTSKGLLIPRMTTQDRTNINPVSPGLIVYDEDEKAFFYYDSTAWLRLITAPAQINLDLDEHKIMNLANGIAAKDAVNKSQLDTKLNKSGGTLSGSLNMGSNKITSLSSGSALSDAINKSQLDDLQSTLQTNIDALESSIDELNQSAVSVSATTSNYCGYSFTLETSTIEKIEIGNIVLLQGSARFTNTSNQSCFSLELSNVPNFNAYATSVFGAAQLYFYKNSTNNYRGGTVQAVNSSGKNLLVFRHDNNQDFGVEINWTCQFMLFYFK